MEIRDTLSSLQRRINSLLSKSKKHAIKSVTLDIAGTPVPAGIYPLPLRGAATIRICIPDDTSNDPIARSFASQTGRISRAFQILPERAAQGGRVVDLGTHLGTFSLYAAALGYEVLAVEASPLNAALLRESVRANGFKNLQVVEAAVSDRETTLEFVAQGPFGHLRSEKHNEQNTIRVTAKPVATILGEVGWDRVDFVKMDVEGSEPAAIRGMAEILDKADAPDILYESNGFTLDFFNESPTSLASLLEQHGYNLYLMGRRELRPHTSSTPQFRTCEDYLATKRSVATVRWKHRPPLGEQDHVARILKELRSGNSNEKSYVLSALDHGDARYRYDTQVAKQLRQMGRQSALAS